MGIVANILAFFSNWHNKKPEDYPSVSDCLEHINAQGANAELISVLAIIKKFENEGIILRIGIKGDDPVYDATYISHKIHPEYLRYGSYDYSYYGFKMIRSRFEKSVLPVEVTKSNGDLDIGSCFIIDGNQIMTAYHCIKQMSLVKIVDPHGQIIKPSAIHRPNDDSDVAIIELPNYNCGSVPNFKIEWGSVLDDVLTMGFPPIPTFYATLISEVSHVGAVMKYSTGKLVAEATNIYDPESVFLLNARVKGGNSGGPVINEMGFAVGMIIEAPASSEDASQLDHLGYGVALTGGRLSRFYNNTKTKKDIISIPFTNSDKGFTTIVE